MSLLIGAYSPDMNGTARGISAAETASGTFAVTGEVIPAASPSWVTVRGDRMVATLEGTGELAWFARTDSGWVADGVVALGGVYPCHAAFLDDDTVAVACYGDGAVIVVRHGETSIAQRLDGEGSGPLEAQEGPHAHHVHVLADGRVLSIDLGADRVHVHTRGEDGLLRREDALELPAGTGPRDLHALPDGHVALLGEWSCELFVLEVADGRLDIVQTLPLPGATAGADQASALGVSGDGRYLYAGIRGSHRLAVFALDASGASAVGWVPSGGAWPRHFLVDGDRIHVANQLSNEVVSFAIGADGMPAEIGRVTTPSPTCVVISTP